ncbi:uncharacterized protein LOC133332513 [Musca vetustissima]|uniref:uncharacterized protein LOC133332513 n=1 Tax=Musca vetustissima TaxID=27455 RepID=UPI002AB75FA1|nr:uncharacterized protein LOC133332513 [Musca vetustissima]
MSSSPNSGGPNYEYGGAGGAAGTAISSSPTSSGESPPQQWQQPGPTVELMHMNGRKVLGPPEDWVGPPPSSVCELFVRRIPRDLNEHKLLAPFLRFGRIYEIRLPMDFNQSYRGYAYVKYTNEEDAACAMEVLNHYYVQTGRKLEILHSYEKCRLFVTNIPKHLEEHEIESEFRKTFPTMERIYTRPSSDGGNYSGGGGGGCGGDSVSPSHGIGNRGHVFVHFPSHLHALEAKKNITPGLIRMWDKDLKVVWAHTDRENNATKASKTLFVRNVDLTVNNRDIIELLVKYVPRTTVCKISKVRTTAFFDFTTREAAEICLKQLQGVELRGRRLDVEWAKPSEQQSLHRMRGTDFDAVLRLKCIANCWHIPIIIFGCYYEQEHLQYGVVILRDAHGMVRATFCLMKTTELVDIHSRMCEVVCALIETIGAFPDYNYVFMVEKDSAHLLGMIMFNPYSPDFMAACGVPPDFHFDLNELIDLSSAVISLSYLSENILLTAYKESFRCQSDCTYLQNWPLIGHRLFGTIMPKYRNKPPLKYNLNDTQIVMALCFKTTGTNAASPTTRQYTAFRVCSYDQGYEGLRYVTLKLLPVALTQSRFVVSHVLSHVLYGGTQYYHPSQRIMLPPLWITGCSYAESIKQLPHFEPKKEENPQEEEKGTQANDIINNMQQLSIQFTPQQSSTPTPPQHSNQQMIPPPPGIFISTTTASYNQAPVPTGMVNYLTQQPVASFPNAAQHLTLLRPVNGGYSPP